MKLRARRRDSKREERGHVRRALAEVGRDSRGSLAAACISRAFPFVRPSLSSADFHLDIRDDDDSARRLANPRRSWTTCPRRCARAMGLLYLYFCRSARKYRATMSRVRRPPSRFSRKYHERKYRELFFYAARPLLRPLADFPARFGVEGMVLTRPGSPRTPQDPIFWKLTEIHVFLSLDLNGR